jgi:hypothetical protein
MATKKSSKKSSGTKKSAAKKRPVKQGAKRRRRSNVPPPWVAPGNPPIILGGGGSIVIYSMEPLEVPDDIPPLAGYPYVYVYPDRTLSPKHFRSKKKVPGGGQVWKKTFNPKTDLLEVETE